ASEFDQCRANHMVGTACSSLERRKLSSADTDRPLRRGFHLPRRKARYRDRWGAALRIKTGAARRRRDAYLAGKGFRVLRFNNYDVMINRQGVLETIAAAIERAPSLTLPRKRGRGRKSRSRAV